MVTEEQWTALLIYCQKIEDQLLKTPEPETSPEKPTIKGAGEHINKGEINYDEKSTGGEVHNGETISGEKNMERKLDGLAAEVATSNKPLLMNPKITDPQIPQSSVVVNEIINKNLNSSTVKSQTTQMSQLITSIGKLAKAAIQNAESITQSVGALKNELSIIRKERDEKRKIFMATIEKLTNSINKNSENETIKIKALDQVADKINNILYEMEYIGEEGEDEKEDEQTNQNSKIKVIEQTINKNETNCQLLDEIKELQQEVAKLKETENNQNKAKNSLINNVKETIQLAILNNGGNLQRNYRLTTSMKFEHFYDFFTSELRSLKLLHIINKEISSNITDVAKLDEQKYQVRDILINHLDYKYLSKVSHLQDPIEIINLLRESKRNENNITSHAKRKKLFSMEYIVGKQTASEFCEKFDEIVRDIENSQGAVPLTEQEKKDAFYAAVMVSVPAVQTIEFVSKRTTGAGNTYETLKSIVLQDEAEKKEASGEKNLNAVKAANLASTRCYECQSYGHFGRDCPNKGKGVQCYGCFEFGHTKFECTKWKPKGGRGRGQGTSKYKYMKYNNTGDSVSSGSGRDDKGAKRKNTENQRENNYGSKRGRFSSYRGRGYKHRKFGYNKKPITKQENDKSGDKKKGEFPINLQQRSKNSKIEKETNSEAFYTNLLTNNNTIVSKFIADTGATENLSKSKIMFNSFNEIDCGVIRCANKDEGANLKTEGVGAIEIILNNLKIRRNGSCNLFR